MIITKIRIQEEHPAANSSTSWPLSYCDLNLDVSAGANGYLLKAASGLGPPSFLAIVDGFDINGVPIMTSAPDKREIALRIGFVPGIGQTVSDLRGDLYKLISRSLLLSLMQESKTVAQISGFIKGFDAGYFTKSPEVQVVFECLTADFVSPESLTIPSPVINTLTPKISYNEGDAPTGLDLTFKCTASHSGFSISNYSNFWHSQSYSPATVTSQFSVSYSFLTNDEITISTHTKNRRVTLLRSGVTYDLAGYINAGAVWPRLNPGVNAFTWDFASSWGTWLSASYVPRYWGV